MRGLTTLSLLRARSDEGASVERARRRAIVVMRWLSAADVAGVALAMLVLALVAGSPLAPDVREPGWSALIAIVVIPVVLGLGGLRAPGVGVRGDIREQERIATCVALAALVWLLVPMLVADQTAGREEALTALVGAPLVVASIVLCRYHVRRRLRRHYPERVLILGAGSTGQALAQAVRWSSGAEIAGFVDDLPRELAGSLADVPVFPETTNLDEIAQMTGATRLVVAFSRRPAEEVLASIRESRCASLPISVVPRYYEITPGHATVSELGGFPMLNMSSARLSPGARIGKRALDIVIATGALVVLAPVLAVIAAAIKLTSRGPVFFRQERVGYRGRPFRIVKFRTMYAGAELQRAQMAHLNEMVGGGPLFKMRNDPRVTPVGRILRRTSLDELPQLLNVLGGSMSLVGPRPFVTHEARQIDGWATVRLELVPGITGLWQVRGRNDVPFEEMVRLDYLYVSNWSPWWDIRILLETIPRVLTGRGAS